MKSKSWVGDMKWCMFRDCPISSLLLWHIGVGAKDDLNGEVDMCGCLFIISFLGGGRRMKGKRGVKVVFWGQYPCATLSDK